MESTAAAVRTSRRRYSHGSQSERGVPSVILSDLVGGGVHQAEAVARARVAAVLGLLARLLQECARILILMLVLRTRSCAALQSARAYHRTKAVSKAGGGAAELAGADSVLLTSVLSDVRLGQDEAALCGWRVSSGAEGVRATYGGIAGIAGLAETDDGASVGDNTLQRGQWSVRGKPQRPVPAGSR